uniref:Uncharacterized protein n=1 Tax=Rhizophagus irregularis (strain DAOM 181602 / DAOM 197198 / MUCL 43194) TaxID=747089 RepID=U9TBT3_RHIID
MVSSYLFVGIYNAPYFYVVHVLTSFRDYQWSNSFCAIIYEGKVSFSKMTQD